MSAMALTRILGLLMPTGLRTFARVSNVAKLMSDAGLITLVSFISPFRSERQMARNMMADGEFVENLCRHAAGSGGTARCEGPL